MKKKEDQNQKIKFDTEYFSQSVLFFLVSLVEDKAKSKVFTNKMKEALAGIEDDALSNLYQEISDYLIKKQSFTSDSLKERVLEQIGEIIPNGIFLISFDSKIQFFLLCLLFIDQLSVRLSKLIGRKVINRILASSAKDTPFDTYQLGDVFKWKDVALTHIDDVADDFAKLMDQYVIHFSCVLDKQILLEIFETMYSSFSIEYDFIANIEVLMDSLPDQVLLEPRRKRLIELRKQVGKVKEKISVSDTKISKQADELIKKVEELKKANEKLQVVDSARSDFVRVVSHQFRTPLSIIRWNSDLLGESLDKLKTSEEEKEMMKAIKQKNIFLIRALEKIFHALAIDTKSVIYDHKQNYLWEIVQDAINDHKKEIKEKAIKLKFEKNDKAIVPLDLDAPKIKEVVSILLSNAVNYSHDGGIVNIKIIMSKTGGKDKLKFVIQDQGIGIPKADLKKVHDKFYRGDNAVKVVADGTGLGMYIVKNFVEGHNGTIKIESDVDKGCKITILLPIK